MTPYDLIIEDIERTGYHNHRSESHSDVLCKRLFVDLMEHCQAFREDARSGAIKHWLNVDVPGMNHKADMMICDTDGPDEPTFERARLCLENKSVITAHGKNRKNRHGDLYDFFKVIQAHRREVIVVGSVLVGTALQYLNVPDVLKPACELLGRDFDAEVLPRLSSGDSSLWDIAPRARSLNRPQDPQRTADLMRTLPVKPKGHTHEDGYDALLIAPVFINNVDPPRVDRDNGIGIDVDAEYKAALDRICRAYTARFHTIVGPGRAR